jgi:hypothetical protein
MNAENTKPKLLTQDDLAAKTDFKPIVLKLKKQKKSNRRYSPGLDEFQRAERHLTKASHRMAQAVEKGISDYRQSSQKSADSKKDGALRDFGPNSALALSKALKEASPIPYELAQAANTKRARRRLRGQLKFLSRTLRVMRW